MDVFSPQKASRRLTLLRSTICSSEDFWDMSIETKPQKSFFQAIVVQLFGCFAQYFPVRIGQGFANSVSDAAV